MKTPWSKEYYHLADGKVWWGESEVKRADPKTFKPFNHIWAKDAKHIYTHDSVNKLADPKTFEALNHIYARDKNHAFYLSGIIKEAEAATFRVLDPGRRANEMFTTPPTEDHDLGWAYEGFACDATQVFYHVSTIGKPCVLRGVDPATFEVLPHGYGRDVKSAYFNRYRLKDSRPRTFRILNHHFSTDDATVFYGERAIAGADAVSFKILGEFWAKDRTRVYFQDKIVDADPATIKLIFKNFACDKQRVYEFGGNVLERADPMTFKHIGGPYSFYYKDKSRVYFDGFGGGWIKGADAATFRVIDNAKNDGPDAKDAHSSYQCGKPMTAGARSKSKPEAEGLAKMLEDLFADES